VKKLYFTASFLLFLSFGAGLFAQNAVQFPAPTREFSPYVSQINVEARNNLIRITWTDSPDARGPVYIFRSARPFTGSVPANIRPIMVRYGEQFFVDDAEDMENLFYYIAASDTSGQRYDVILPRINSTSLTSIQTEESFSLDAGSIAPQEGIYNLRAVRDGDKVVITFSIAGTPKNAILYRSTHPIQNPRDLLNAVIVRSRIGSPFIDYPVPGITWYYALIYEDEIASGDMGIKPGANATVNPVAISGTQAMERSLRPIPLPVMTLQNAMPDSFFITEIPSETGLSAESEILIRNKEMPQKAPLTLKRARVYTDDLVAPAGGEDSALFQIVTEQFIKLDWNNARESLKRYLSSPRSREIDARARFYLGQTLYFTGNYKQALMEFLSFRALNAEEANRWIEAVLAAMVY